MPIEKKSSNRCPNCSKPFEVFESAHMHHYFDDDIGIWATRWICEDIECCPDCHTLGASVLTDDFETPRFLTEHNLKIWSEKKLEGRKVL